MPSTVRTVERHHAELVVDDATGIGTLSIRNAKSVNVLSAAVVRELVEVLDAAREDDALRVLVLRGSGDRAFVGGADVAEIRALDETTAEGFIRGVAGLCEAVRLFPRPVIVRLTGWCLGAGLELAAAADLRIGSATAVFAMPEIEIGVPSVVHAALLPAIVGAGRANYLVMTGERVDAPTALAWGLLDELADDLDARIDETARRLASFGPHVVAQQKRLVRDWTQEEALARVERSVTEFVAAFRTDEPRRYGRHLGG